MSIKGIDISNNDGAVNCSAIANDGVNYVYIKATEGQSFKDPYKDEFYNDCKANGLKVGAYHFLVGTSSPEAQAENFYISIKDYEWDLVPMMDIEANFDGLSDYVIRFVNRFKELCPWQLGVYSYTSFISYIEDAESVIKDFPFWEANYNNDPWNLRNNFFTNRIGHQYSETGKVNGVNTNCDLNEFTEGVLLNNVSIEKGTWKVDEVGWWFEYEDQTKGKYPISQWAKLPKGNNDPTPKWFYFNEKGYMQTNWIYWNGNYYFLGQENDGSLKTAWYYDVNYSKWFYANENGEMQKGWLKDESTGKWYYLQPNKTDKYVEGEMRTGWINEDGKLYLLYSDGSMAHDIQIYGYSIDCHGVATKL